MKIKLSQLKITIKEEVKRLGGKAVNEAPRATPRSAYVGRADGRPGPVDDESDRARARRGRAPMPKVAPPETAPFDGTVAGLILALKKMPADMTVMFGEDGAFDTASLLEIIYFDDDMMQVEEEDGGTPHVVIMSL